MNNTIEDLRAMGIDVEVVMEHRPYYKLDRRERYNCKGFAEGVKNFLTSDSKGLIITPVNTNTFILVEKEDITPQALTYGDKTMLNYVASVGRLLTRGEVEEMSKSETDIYHSVTLKSEDKKRDKRTKKARYK